MGYIAARAFVVAFLMVYTALLAWLVGWILRDCLPGHLWDRLPTTFFSRLRRARALERRRSIG